MRYFELLRENTEVNLKDDIIDIIVNLKSQGINSITIPQILDILRKKSEYNGLSLDQNVINDVLTKVKNISTKPDMENDGILTVYIDTPGNLPQNNKKSNKNKVDSMAQKTIKNSLKGD